MGLDVHHLPIFNNLREEIFRVVEPLLEAVSFPAGDFVIRQDSPAEYLYIILSGTAQISFKPYDAMPITISHVESGGLFGWSAVIGSGKYTSSVVAIEPLDVLRIRGSELRRLTRENPEAGRELMNCLADAISTRWKDAREQVRLILEHGMK